MNPKLAKLLKDKVEIGENPIELTDKDYEEYTKFIDDAFPTLKGTRNEKGYTFQGIQVKLMS